MNNFNLKIATTPYSKREAWTFLQVNGPELNFSIRNLGTLWKWNRSKVERFLKVLKSETLIETKISHGKTTVIIQANQSINEVNHFNSRDNFETLNETDIHEIEIKNQSQDSFEAKNKTLEPLEIHDVQEIAETNPRQFQDTYAFEEEKKKRSKKMKNFIQANNDIFKSTKYSEKMLSRNEAAKFLEIKKNTLAVWACTKRYNLPMYKIGRHIKYKMTDLEKFIEENIIL